MLVLAAVFFVAVYTAGTMAREWGEDPGPVVVDEAVGYLVSVAFLPHSLWVAVGAFFAFRILDILKPAPARQLERLPGGWGIVLDDVMAGIYSQMVVRAAVWLAAPGHGF